MKTVDLIDVLAAEAGRQPVRRFGWRLAAAAGAGSLAALAMVLVLYGLRPDLAQALVATVLKASFGLIAALAITPAVLKLSRPNIKVGAAFFSVGAFVAASLFAALAHLAYAHSVAPLGLARGAPECLKRVPLLAVPIAIILGVVIRSFAPTRLAYAGAAVGALSAAIAIVPYAFFCPFDSLAYVATWYLVSILICAGIGAILGPRLLRWT